MRKCGLLGLIASIPISSQSLISEAGKLPWRYSVHKLSRRESRAVLKALQSGEGRPKRRQKSMKLNNS